MMVDSKGCLMVWPPQAYKESSTEDARHRALLVFPPSRQLKSLSGPLTLASMSRDIPLKVLCLAHLQLIKEYLLNDNIVPIWLNPLEQWDLLDDLLDILEKDLEESVALAEARRPAVPSPRSSPSAAPPYPSTPEVPSTEAPRSERFDYSSLDDLLSIIEKEMAIPASSKSIHSPDTSKAHHRVNTPTSSPSDVDDVICVVETDLKTSVARCTKESSRLLPPAPGCLKSNYPSSCLYTNTLQKPAAKKFKSHGEYPQYQPRQTVQRKFQQHSYMNPTTAHSVSSQLGPTHSQVANWLQEKSLNEKRECETWVNMHASRLTIKDGRCQQSMVGSSPGYQWSCEPYIYQEPSPQILIQASHASRVGNSSQDLGLIHVCTTYSGAYPLALNYTT